MQLTSNMPDLSKLKNQIVFFALRRVFIGAGPSDPVSYALVMNIIRLSDQAISEYNNAREALIKYFESSDAFLFYILKACGHFEVLVSDLSRVTKYLVRLKNRKESPMTLKSNIPKNTKLLKNSVRTAINNMRNSVHHMDNEIIQSQFKAPQALCLMPIVDKENSEVYTAIEIANYSILFEDLACWLTELHDIAKNLQSIRIICDILWLADVLVCQQMLVYGDVHQPPANASGPASRYDQA